MEKEHGGEKKTVEDSTSGTARRVFLKTTQLFFSFRASDKLGCLGQSNSKCCSFALF